MRLATAFLALLFLAPTPHAQASENVELLGVYNGRSDYADTWGYTAPDGREYALVALRASGMVIVDITDAMPVEVGFVPTAVGVNASDSKDVKVYDHYAYLVNERGPLQIIDLADPANPQQVGLLFNDQQTSNTDHGSHNLLIANDHLWLTGGPQSGGVQVFDLVDPENPQYVSALSPLYYHDFEIRGDIGFGPAIYGQGVDIIDVSDPSNLQIITRFNYAGSGAHNTCTSEDLTHIYVGDEIGSSGNWTRVFDISDYANENVDFVTDIAPAPSAVVHNCYVRGDRLYIAHYTEGLQVYDISTPSAPVRVGFYDTFPGSGSAYSGAWSVYPYFASGKIIVSDRSNGLHVFQMTGNAVDADDAPTAAFALSASPNPAADRTRLAFELPAAAQVTLVVSDALGREVARLIDGSFSAGSHSALFETAGLAPGVYVTRLTADGRTATQSVVVAR